MADIDVRIISNNSYLVLNIDINTIQPNKMKIIYLKIQGN